jgi:hypothetical protein
VLDLDGDGFELLGERVSKVHFELGRLRRAHRRASRDDGLLALDGDANGTIDNVTELFGNQSVCGFAMLGAHDLNADGVIELISSAANDNAAIRLAA